MRETLLKREFQSATQHVWAHNLFVLSIQNNATAALIMLIKDVSLRHDRKAAIVLVPARLRLHERSILLFGVFEHFLYVAFIFFSAANDKRRFEEFNHGLQDQIFQSSKITSPILSSHLLESDLHFRLNLLDAIVSFIHFDKLGLQNLLRSLDVKIKLALLQSVILIGLMFLASLHDHLVPLFFETSLSQDLDLECFLVGILSEHSLHFKGALAKSHVGTTCSGHYLSRSITHFIFATY